MIPFSPPRIDEQTVKEVSEALLSGWITTGPKTKLFEKEIAAYTGVQKVICLNSATAGLELSLKWFNIGPGDEVILPVYTYCATANVVEHLGATPVFVDINPDDFNISLAAIASKITSKTKAIMPVDISGWPCDYDELNALVTQKRDLFVPQSENQEKLGRILVLSDAAHSFGASYKDQKTGNQADISVFSFHAVKNLTTAEGGAVAFNLPSPFDLEEIYKEYNIRSLHGQSKDALSKTQAGQWRYDVIEPGYKCNMTDIHAAIGRVELKRYEESLARRADIFKTYNDAFKNESWAELPPYLSPNKESSYHLYMLRIKNISEEQRDEIIRKISEQGVSVNVHFQPLPLLSYYKNKGYKIEDYPIAFDQYSREISLPIYYTLNNEQVETVITTVKQAIKDTL